MAQSKKPKPVKTSSPNDQAKETGPTFIEEYNPEPSLKAEEIKALQEFKKLCEKSGGKHIETPKSDFCITSISKPQADHNKGNGR